MADARSARFAFPFSEASTIVVRTMSLVKLRRADQVGHWNAGLEATVAIQSRCLAIDV